MRLKTLIILIFMTHIAYSKSAMWVALPQYDQITAFNEGVAAVNINGKWGYIDDSGKTIAECKYDVVYPFSDGVGVATSFDDTVVAIINKNGSTITEFKDRKGEDKLYKVDPRFPLFGDGLLLITDGSVSQLYNQRYKKWGYINKSGVLQIDIKYFGALPFSEGIAGVANENLTYAYITPNGFVAITNDFNKGSTIGAMGFYMGKSIVVGEKGLTYIDTHGKKISGSLAKFSPAENFYNTTNSYIRGKDGSGNLEFNNKGCVTSIINAQGERVVLREDLDNDQPLIIHKFKKNAPLPDGLTTDGLAVVDFDGKLGLLMVNEDSMLKIRLKNDIVEATDGATTNIHFAVENTSNMTINNIDIYCNDDLIANNVEIESLGREFIVPIANIANEDNYNISLNIRLDNQGLELLNEKYNTTIIYKSYLDDNVTASSEESTESATDVIEKIVSEDDTPSNTPKSDKKSAVDMRSTIFHKF